MNKTTIRVIISVLVILLFIPRIVNAQEKEKEDNIYWKIVHYKVDHTKVDSLKILEEKYYKPKKIRDPKNVKKDFAFSCLCYKLFLSLYICSNGAA